MRELAQLLQEMQTKSVIRNCALFTREAMEKAETADLEGIPIRVVRADYLAVMALGVGRAKDYTRILALLESGSITRQETEHLAGRHGLETAWRRFVKRFLDE